MEGQTTRGGKNNTWEGKQSIQRCVRGAAFVFRVSCKEREIEAGVVVFSGSVLEHRVPCTEREIETDVAVSIH